MCETDCTELFDLCMMLASYSYVCRWFQFVFQFEPIRYEANCTGAAGLD